MSHPSESIPIALPPLLIVEDSHEDFEALHRCIVRSPLAIPIYLCTTSDQALAFLYHTGEYRDPACAPRPGLILLDLNLPGMEGQELLRRIKQDDALKSIPVVIFTTSRSRKDIEICYQLGANGYIVKPVDYARLKRGVELLLEYWFDFTTLPPQQSLSQAKQH